jgi:hypothetical protein
MDEALVNAETGNPEPVSVRAKTLGANTNDFVPTLPISSPDEASGLDLKDPSVATASRTTILRSMGFVQVFWLETRIDSQGTAVLENPILFASQKPKEITGFLKPGIALEIYRYLTL